MQLQCPPLVHLWASSVLLSLPNHAGVLINICRLFSCDIQFDNDYRICGSLKNGQKLWRDVSGSAEYSIVFSLWANKSSFPNSLNLSRLDIIFQIYQSRNFYLRSHNSKCNHNSLRQRFRHARQIRASTAVIEELFLVRELYILRII